MLLLDDGVNRYDMDGMGSTTYRMVAQVLKQEAVEIWAEHTFSYNPERERFRPSCSPRPVAPVAIVAVKS